MQSSDPSHAFSDARARRQPLPRAFVGTQGAYEHICAYGLAMGWGDRPFDFVVRQWLASRPDESRHRLLMLQSAAGPAA